MDTPPQSKGRGVVIYVISHADTPQVDKMDTKLQIHSHKWEKNTSEENTLLYWDIGSNYIELWEIFRSFFSYFILT